MHMYSFSKSCVHNALATSVRVATSGERSVTRIRLLRNRVDVLKAIRQSKVSMLKVYRSS
jgi:hypothetical protein